MNATRYRITAGLLAALALSCGVWIIGYRARADANRQFFSYLVDSGASGERELARAARLPESEGKQALIQREKTAIAAADARRQELNEDTVPGWRLLVIQVGWIAGLIGWGMTIRMRQKQEKSEQCVAPLPRAPDSGLSDGER